MHSKGADVHPHGRGCASMSADVRCVSPACAVRDETLGTSVPKNNSTWDPL